MIDTETERHTEVRRANAHLVASAQLLAGTRYDDPARTRRSWQEEAWRFYDESGALRYGVTWESNLCKRARLLAAKVPPGGDEPEILDSGPASEAMDAFGGGFDCRTQLLYSLAVQLLVPGACYLIGTGEKWKVLSGDALRIKSHATPGFPAVYEERVGEGAWEELPLESLVVRVWRPHERFSWDADSPTRAALPALRELQRVEQYIDATLVSRVAGAGFFIFPQEARFPTAPKENSGQHPFVTEVMNVMMTAVKQPGTASQIVPIPIEVPAEYADKFKFVTWSSEVSDKIIELRQSALKSLSIAVDIPPEILLGMGDVNHWTSWQLEEAAIKVHVEPLLQVIVAELSKVYLRPVLIAGGMSPEEAEDFIVWFDTSDIVSRPDRSANAIQVYDRGELSGEALRRETGMADTDEPTDEELAKWAYKKLVGDPTLTPPALDQLGIEFEAPEPPETAPVVVAPEDIEGEAQGPPQTRDEQPPPPGSPEFASLQHAKLLALEAYVTRALEVGRNRMNNNGRGDPLEGALHGVTMIAEEFDYDPVLTHRELESYCRTILTTDSSYSRESLARVMFTLHPHTQWVA